MAVKDSEKSIKDEKELVKDEIEVSEAKENANEDVETTKHDKIIMICSEIIEIKKKLGHVSMPDLEKIVGKEFFSNGTSLFAVPGDKRYIEVLGILGNISSIVNTLSTEISLEELVKRVEDQFDKLSEISGSFKDSTPSKADEDKQLFSALEYLDNLKKSNRSKLLSFDELITAFVIGKIINNESERIFLTDIAITQMSQFMSLINSANFDIKDEIQVNTCKTLLLGIKQAVSLNKAVNKFTGAGKPFPFPTIPPTMPGIDPKIYQKAAAFDKIVEALRPGFIELMVQSKGFDSPLNGWGNVSF